MLPPEHNNDGDEYPPPGTTANGDSELLSPFKSPWL